MRKLERALWGVAKAHGATVDTSSAGHLKIRGNGWTVTTAGTPSDLTNTLRNVRRDVRRAVLMAAA